MLGSGLSLLWEGLCGIITLQSVGLHPAGMGFGLIVIAPFQQSCCGVFFIFVYRVSFLVGFHVFLSINVQQLVVIFVFL